MVAYECCGRGRAKQDRGRVLRRGLVGGGMRKVEVGKPRIVAEQTRERGTCMCHGCHCGGLLTIGRVDSALSKDSTIGRWGDARE